MAEGDVPLTERSTATAPKHPGQRLLEKAIWALALPTSPPARSTRDVLGLHLIQSALRLEHVDRVSEQLSLVDATHMARTIDIDVNIDNLSEDKETALTVPGSRSLAPGDEPVLYVPIARHPRESLVPVVLRDADGHSLTRLSSRITNRLLAAGMIRLFRLLAAADGAPKALRGGDLVPTWLIEASILALVEDGRQDWPRVPAVSGMDSARAVAVTALPQLFTHDITPRTAALWDAPTSTAYVGPPPEDESSFHAFYRLIQALTTDQVIVALIPRARRQTRISYQTPELRGTFRSGLRRLFVPTRDFTMEYTTTIPADVDSFHVSIQVPDALEVRRFVMMSDADHNADVTTRYDLVNLAYFMRPKSSGSPRTLLVESELVGISSRLDEIMRRRAEDYREYRRYLDKLRARGGYERPGLLRGVKALPDLKALLRSTRGGRRLVTAHRALPNGRSLAPQGGDDPGWFDVDGQLLELAKRLKRADLGKDLHVDNDPRETAGHIQWRRHATGLGLSTDQPVRARVFLALADSNPTAGLQVLGFLVVNLMLVASVVWAFGYFDAAESAAGQSEVLVTLLLLVPGLLLNRLGLWPRRSLTSRVRRFPAVVAIFSIVVNVILAVAIAVIPAEAIRDDFGGFYPGAIGALSALALFMVVYVSAELVSRQIAVPPFTPVPAWLRDEFRVSPIRRAAQASVTFSERADDEDV